MIKTFSIRETNLDHANVVRREILTYRHVENMLLILLDYQYKVYQTTKLSSDKKLFGLLKNAVIMKPVMSGAKGGLKTANDVALVRSAFQHHPVFQAMVKITTTQCNDKLCSMIVRRVQAQYKVFFDNLKKGVVASPPSPVKLRNVVRFSLNLEKSKWTYFPKKGKLRLTLSKKRRNVYIGSSDYLTTKTLKSININVEHGYVYYNLRYEESAPAVPMPTTRKYAGIDVGMYNLLSLFVGDTTSQSIIIGGRRLLSYNQNVHKRLSRMQQDLATSSPAHHARIRRQKAQMFRDRAHFFEDSFRKITQRIVQYLLRCEVTDLVISKNLQFAKTTGQLHGGKKHNQKFYGIPFGDLLNKIERKAQEYGIVVHTIDEAYTSKVSSLIPGLLHQIRAASKTTVKVPGKSRFLPKVCGGTRGKKATGLGRGEFKDFTHNVILNADLNAACNHISIAFPQYRPPVGVWHKWCNPRMLLSKHDCESL